MKPLPYIILSNAVSLTLEDGEQHVINSSHPNFNKIIQSIKTKAWGEVEGLIDIPKAIVKASNGKVTVANGEVRYAGLPVNSYLASRILTLMDQGFDINPWVNFMDKLYTNPDPFSITQAYEFLERAKLPLCPDGDFLAYKYVRSDFKDCHTGTFDNSVGQIVTEDRATCDNNPDNHCSRGLHFCAKGYLRGHYGNGSGSTIVLVKVNPRDIVSIPKDHNCEKARACRYEVVGLLDEDYSFEDMEKSEVLPAPRTEAVNAKNKTNKHEDKPTEFQEKVLRAGDLLTVREHAKRFGVTNADIVNSAGTWYFILSKGGALSHDWVVYTIKGQKWADDNNVNYNTL